MRWMVLSAWVVVFGLWVAVAGHLAPLSLVQASTIQGTAVEIAGLNDLSATVDTQSRKGIGKILGYALAAGGLIGLTTGYYGLGAAGLGSGVGFGFVPTIISSSYDGAAAATGAALGAQGSTAWWAPATMGLYPGLLVLKLAQDPVFWASLAVAILALSVVRHTRTRMAVS